MKFYLRHFCVLTTSSITANKILRSIFKSTVEISNSSFVRFPPEGRAAAGRVYCQRLFEK